MTRILEQIYSWPFFLGAIVGTVLLLIYWKQRCNYLDIHEPLPGGAKHHMAHLSRVWIAGLVMVLSVGYILLTAQKTHDQTLDLQVAVNRCWGETYSNLKAQIDLNQQNDQITRQQAQLQRAYNQAGYEWIHLLLAPPGDLANEDTQSPRRKQWGIDISIEYQNKINNINAQMDDLINQRKTLDKEREHHSLPELTCGR